MSPRFQFHEERSIRRPNVVVLEPRLREVMKTLLFCHIESKSAEINWSCRCTVWLARAERKTNNFPLLKVWTISSTWSTFRSVCLFWACKQKSKQSITRMGYALFTYGMRHKQSLVLPWMNGFRMNWMHQLSRLFPQGPPTRLNTRVGPFSMNVPCTVECSAVVFVE